MFPRSNSERKMWEGSNHHWNIIENKAAHATKSSNAAFPIWEINDQQ